MRRWALPVLALVAASVTLVVVLLGGPGSPGSMEERVHQVAAGLRCPVCQSLSVADSSSQVAREMRAEIARDLGAGKSPQEIRDEFAAAYGDWVLLSPPKEGLDLVVWLVPLAALLGGGVLAVSALRRWLAGETA